MLHRLLTWLAPLLALAATVRGQAADPAFDPGFRFQNFYQPSYAVVQQLRGGARLLRGPRRVEGQNVPGLARLLPSEQFDFAFAAHVGGYVWKPQSIVEAPDGKLLVLLEEPATLAGQPVGKLLRLHADGTLDTSFRPPVLGLTIYSVLPLPGGQIILSGKPVATSTLPAAKPVVRLAADGTLAAPLLLTVSNSYYNDEYVAGLLPQPDGKYLVLGQFTKLNGQDRLNFARLNADFSVDGSFLPFAARGVSPDYYSAAPQPDGKLVVSAGLGFELPSGLVRNVVRLNANGSLDPSFLAPEDLGALSLQVRADGRIYAGYYQAGQGRTPLARRLVRLLPTGAYDPSWKFQTYNEAQGVSSVQLLPSGELLVAGPPALYAGPAATPTGVALLDTAGVYQPSFAPLLQQVSSVRNLARQPDGKLLVTGPFTEIQGFPAQGLARLHPSGELDTAFSRRCQLAGPLFAGGNYVALQPDGKVLVTGNFLHAGGLARWGVARLLPTGEGDASFASPFTAPAVLGGYEGGGRVAVQPDGRVLVGGSFGAIGGQYRSLYRLTAAGQLDASFQTTTLTNQGIADILVQLDGRITLIDNGYPQAVVQLLPSGAPDPAFTPVRRIIDSSNNDDSYKALTRYPDGRLLLSGYFHKVGGVATQGLARLLADGTPDPTFQTELLDYDDNITACGLLSDGRIVANVNSFYANLIRLLPNGATDFSFSFSNVPPRGEEITTLLVEPNDAVVVGGNFESLLGRYRPTLVRLVEATTLAVAPGRAAATTAAWPVPAHEVLHLALDAASRPQHVQLLDALGRVVLARPTPPASFSLPTAMLPPGVYLLRVDYAIGGAVTRRVVLE
ncbi:MAG: T9SS type A sorting domain-containing protein [Janthinobacterium lividum]